MVCLMPSLSMTVLRDGLCCPSPEGNFYGMLGKHVLLLSECTVCLQMFPGLCFSQQVQCYSYTQTNVTIFVIILLFNSIIK